jgi:hypothetical protein
VVTLARMLAVLTLAAPGALIVFGCIWHDLRSRRGKRTIDAR